MSDAVVMRDVIVVGGGCYGTFYATQLAKAKEKGKARFRKVVVVDRDPVCRARRELGEAPDREFVERGWTEYFDAFLGSSERSALDAPQDFIVPSPLMPHLMFEWVVRRARARWPERPVSIDAVPGTLGTPYDRVAPDHTRYVSFADWICPTHCIEPAICPAIAGPRTWEMSTAIAQLVERLRADGEKGIRAALFVCRHHVFGVGTFAVDAVLQGDAVVAAAGASGDTAAVLVGTVSACHGAMNLVRIGRSRAGEGGRGRSGT
jgi:hypothetical protein